VLKFLGGFCILVFMMWSLFKVHFELLLSIFLMISYVYVEGFGLGVEYGQHL